MSFKTNYINLSTLLSSLCHGRHNKISGGAGGNGKNKTPNTKLRNWSSNRPRQVSIKRNLKKQHAVCFCVV